MFNVRHRSTQIYTIVNNENTIWNHLYFPGKKDTVVTI